ncbi:biotin/lipoate A/B protein ligase family protein [Microbacterium sp. APC 3898]|uniref:Octanoyltransferase LipM n=1 Tax=Planococcus notacanthi TaxID=3035188 RepID=A0ABT7ZI13_9BACL|nr:MULTISPECIES: biotin/lipoate A/B protein ligase family protein [Terrabacteria group]MDN3426801.1 biotin/lipoate A/B protein ligase family protein [Planococcus sp. APC 4016]MDN3438056.1 biotin/lipoate A/B protein ligase family protein [Planococcus sp. APC 3900]MDN3500311.1 biotin/lipoate A/B protein ligase family protein [Microbacterium sp. APC 3898]
MKYPKWIFINSGAGSPAFNMALDEALLAWHSEGLIPPVIRFYSWQPAALSIGYFQNVEKEIDMEAVDRLGLGFVRRPTGGRGVLHEHELTYSIIVSEDYPEMPETVTEAYRVLSEGLLEGFKNLGLDAYFSVPDTEEKRADLKKPKSAVCFDAPSWYEMVVEGKKVAGSAQTRQKGVILQHGAILIDLDAEKLLSVFKFSSEAAKERMRSKIPEKAVSINSLREKPVTPDECIRAFKAGFEQALSISLESYNLTVQQLADVKALEKIKYGNSEWNFRA